MRTLNHHERYAVYWRADDGDHFQGYASCALSQKQAIRDVVRREGLVDSMRGNLFARPMKNAWEKAPLLIPAAVPAVEETSPLQPQPKSALIKSNLPTQLDLF